MKTTYYARFNLTLVHSYYIMLDLNLGPYLNIVPTTVCKQNTYI